MSTLNNNSPSRLSLLGLPSELRIKILGFVFSKPVIRCHLRDAELFRYRQEIDAAKRSKADTHHAIKWITKRAYFLELQDYSPDITRTCKLIQQEVQTVISSLAITLHICESSKLHWSTRKFRSMTWGIPKTILSSVQNLALDINIAMVQDLSVLPNLKAVCIENWGGLGLPDPGDEQASQVLEMWQLLVTARWGRPAFDHFMKRIVAHGNHIEVLQTMAVAKYKASRSLVSPAYYDCFLATIDVRAKVLKTFMPMTKEGESFGWPGRCPWCPASS